MKLCRMPDGKPEIFHTIQGEGRNTGLPSVFIRASLCNLHCLWCDTDYTWNWNDTSFSHVKDAEPGYQKYRREEMIIDLKISEILEFVRDFNCPSFVFTGGEPLLQQKAWIELMLSLKQRLGATHFEIETNGTLMPGPEFLEQIDQINVSPKLSNSEVAVDLRYKPDVLADLAKTGKADFKFVIGPDSEDFAEVQRIVEEAAIPPDQVFLMPKAISVSELEQNQSAVARLAQQSGYRYSDRLHLRLFGAKRGV